MDTKFHNILAVNPGSRYMGYAVYYDTDLVDWGVKVIPKGVKGSLGKRASKVLSYLIGSHQIKRLILKSLHPSRTSSGLRAIVRSFKQYSVKNRIRIHEYDISRVKQSLIDEGRRNKMNLMDSVSKRFSFLIPEYERAKKEKRPYLVRMFEAVALGINDLMQRERS